MFDTNPYVLKAPPLSKKKMFITVPGLRQHPEIMYNPSPSDLIKEEQASKK